MEVGGSELARNITLRYKFSGGFNLSFEKLIRSTRGFDDYSQATNFNC